MIFRQSGTIGLWVHNLLLQTHAHFLPAYTSYRGVRPFGVSLLIAGFDEDTPFLFQCDPSVSGEAAGCNCN